MDQLDINNLNQKFRHEDIIIKTRQRCSLLNQHFNEPTSRILATNMPNQKIITVEIFHEDEIPNNSADLSNCKCWVAQCWVSSILRPSRHAPGTRSSDSSCAFSSCWFWREGYLILIKLCKIKQVLTINFTVETWCCMVLDITWNLLASIPNAFSTTFLALDSLQLKILSSVVRPRRVKGFIIVGRKVWHIFIGKRFRFG